MRSRTEWGLVRESLTAFRFSIAMRCKQLSGPRVRGGPPSNEGKANLFRGAGSFTEHGFDTGLRAFLAIAAGNAHGVDDLAVHRDGNRTRLREVTHDVGRRQILALADDLARLRARPAPAQGVL